jgi:flagellar biosynthesis/type III secretory pathway protein FliH
MRYPEAILFAQPPKEVVLAPRRGRAEWTAEIAAREAAAFQKGVVEGERRLNEQLVRQRGELLELQNGVLSALTQAVHKTIHDAEAGLIELALETARKLVGDLPVDGEMVAAAVRAALAEAEGATKIDVHLHPEDLARLQAMNPPAVVSTGNGPQAHFHASAEVTRGGCLVYTNLGTIDARRETRLDLIRQALKHE